MYETNRLILKKAEFPDWEQMYRNVWQHEETARYMLWSVTTNEEDAKERMRRTIAFQRDHFAWIVYEKASDQAIGFAGFRDENGVCEDSGICVGPAFVGKGYGKEILNALVDISSVQCGAREFICVLPQRECRLQGNDFGMRLPLFPSGTENRFPGRNSLHAGILPEMKETAPAAFEVTPKS